MRLDALRGSPVGRLVFVCHGNIMRSAFAVAYLREQLPAVADRIIGAGTHATDGRPAQDSAIRVAPALGVDLTAHRARSVERAGLTSSDVVVCMDRANEANVATRFTTIAPRVFLIGDIATEPRPMREVIDPYGHGDEATERAFREVLDLSMQWAALLRAG